MYVFCIPSFVIFQSLIAVLFFHSTLSAPINSSLSYDIFLKNVTRDNCVFPSGVVLPFKESSTTFQYFSEPLKICKAPETMKGSREAIMLCTEIYDALRNITCQSAKNFHLPEIKIEFSDNVCKDINSLKLQHALEEKSLLQHLTDEITCNMICEDDFLPACKVLLWSYQLKKRIAGIPEVQSIQNSLDQDNTNVLVESGASSVSKTVKLDKEDIGNDNELQPSKSTKVPVADIDTKGISSQTLKSSTDKLTIAEDNKIPGEQIGEANKGDTDKLDKKQDETPKLFEEKQPDQSVNGVSNVREETVKTEQKEQTPIVDEKSIKDNAINENDGPPKLSETSDSGKTILKNNPAVLVPGTKNKTELKKEVPNIQNNLSPVTQNEVPAEVKPMDTKIDNSTSNELKPAIPGLQDGLNKMPETLSRPSTPSKTSPVLIPEAELPIKPAVVLTKENKVTDTPTVKEDIFSVTTIANFENGEDGNGVQEPADKNPDLYNEEESVGDYNKSEEDDYDFSKNQKPEESESEKILKPSVAENESSKYVFSQRNSFGRGSEDIPVIPPFPEQEDSHFFFYFLSLVLILMAGYLLFHNKQKIIALIVEGRHERRRRSHGLGYKKLETK